MPGGEHPAAAQPLRYPCREAAREQCVDLATLEGGAGLAWVASRDVPGQPGVLGAQRSQGGGGPSAALVAGSGLLEPGPAAAPAGL